MPTIQELLEAKNARLESVPDQFLSDMTKVQLELIDEVIDLLATFEIDQDGLFVLNKKNLKLAGEVDVILRQVLERSEYSEFVTEFSRQFNTQVGFNDDYFKEAFPGFTSSEVGKQMVLNAQRNAVQLLVNVSPDASFIMPIKQQIELSIVNNASYKDTITALRKLVVGDTEEDGKILRYAKQIAHDAFALSDASYASVVADEMNAEWFKYSGSSIATTRPFCRERKGRYYCRKEIELWGAGENTEPKRFEWPQDKTWAGEMEGTDSHTIFSTRGGYNCRDSIMALSIFAVPIREIERAIELGFYVPTEFEIKELGLAIQ